MKRVKKSVSLQKKLIILVVVGYALPVLMTVYFSGEFMREQYDQQRLDKIEVNLHDTTELTSIYLDTMIEDSRRISSEGEVERAYKRYLTDENQSDLFQWVQTRLNLAFWYNSLVLTAMLYYEDESLPSQYVFNDETRQNKSVLRMYQEIKGEVEEIAENIGSNLGFYSRDNRLFLIRNLTTSEFQPYGTLVMEVNFAHVLGAFQAITGVSQVDITVGDADIHAKIGEEPTEILLFSQEITVQSHKMMVTLGVDADQGTESLQRFQEQVYLILVLVVPSLLSLLFNFSRHITKPLDVLISAERQVEGGNLGYQVESMPETREFEAIYRGFNAMSRSMKEQFEQSYQEQLALHDARMKTLQSQINPHFLNNTLEIINWETRIAGNTNASEMIEALSVMLGATMDREGKGKIPFHQELTYVDAYLYIQSRRMGNRLTVEKNIHPDSLDYIVPRLAFQPLVENACDHGISKQRKGKIVVSTYLTANNLILEVKNTGRMSEENQALIKELLEWDENTERYGSGVRNLGIKNVNLRMKMMYGEAFGIDMYHENDDMTVARLALPLEKGGEADPLSGLSR